MKPTHDALPQPHVDGRRGVHPRLSARRGRAARRLRQDGAGAADGRRQRRRAGDHAHGRAVGGGVLPRPRARRRHRPLALRRRAARRTDDAGGVRRARGGGDALASATATSWAPRRRWRRWSRRSACRCPGPSTIPAVRRGVACAPPRRRARARSRSRARALRRLQILTADAFDNAITLLMALGGGTNAVVHLLALAGRARRAADARPLRRALPAHAACSRTCGRRASTSSRTSTAPAACRPCCTSSRRCSHGDALTVTGGRSARRSPAPRCSTAT